MNDKADALAYLYDLAHALEPARERAELVDLGVRILIRDGDRELSKIIPWAELDYARFNVPREVLALMRREMRSTTVTPARGPG